MKTVFFPLDTSFDAPPILCPVQSVYDITPCDPVEVAPLIAHLASDTAFPNEADGAIVFPRGTVLPDGRLDLCKQSLGPDNCRRITRALSSNTRIKSLLLGTDGIGDAGAADVAELVCQNTVLEVVYLGCNRITGAGAAHVCDALQKNASVTGLWLKRNPIGPDGAYHVAKLLRANTTLRTLDLVNTGIGPDGLEAVLNALIDENRTVERLYLGGNQIGPEAAPKLAALLRQNAALRALLLNVNNVGDAGAETIASALAENRTLEELGLASCGIGSAGGRALFDVLHGHPTLRDLDLGYSPSTRVLGALGNTLGDKGAYAAADFLGGNPPLRRLTLNRNQVGRPGRARIVRALKTNTHLWELHMDGPRDPEIGNALERNRAAAGLRGRDLPSVSADVALIRSVYRTAHPPERQLSASSTEAV